MHRPADARPALAGRAAPGGRGEGEACRSTWPVDHAAQITFQSFFRLYKKLAGMTGTLVPELLGDAAGVPALGRTQVPTNRPIMRECCRTAVFPTEDAKFDAVVQDVRQMLAAGPAGADRHADAWRRRRSCQRELTAAGDHAPGAQRRAERRGGARSSPQAGQPGTVTVATNMAGRGTDIKLGPGRGRGGRPARDRHGAARGGADRPAAAGPRRPAGRPRAAGSSCLRWRTSCSRASGTSGINDWSQLGRAGGNRDWNQFRPAVRARPKEDGAEALPAAAGPDELREAAEGNAGRPGGGPVRGLTAA